jgi:hypothetical protein
VEAPGRPHVRVHKGYVWIERAPNAWVQVVHIEEWRTLNEPEQNYMIEKALKSAPDCELS